MTYTASTLAEARRIEADMRDALQGSDWEISIKEPLFDGDTYMVIAS